MEKELFEKITQNFNEFKPLLIEQKNLKKLVFKNKRKLNTLTKRYGFLKSLVGNKINDDLLVVSVVKFFKELDFNNIKNVDKKGRNEDLRIVFENKLLLVEITGIKSANATDNKTRQLTKHLDEERKNNENVFALTIFNHDYEKNYNEREKNCFSKDQIKYAETGKYGLTTTVQLLNAFMKIKEDKLSTEDFKKEILKFGEVKF